MTAITRPIRRLFGRAEPIARRRAGAGARRCRRSSPGSPSTSPRPTRCSPTSRPRPGPVDLARLELASPALDELRAAGVALVVPLVTQGELIGTLNLGPRLSEQDYSSDDRRLLGDARGPGRAGDPRRPAGPRAGRGGRRARALRAGAQGRAADPAAVPAARAAEAARVADRRLLRPGPRRRRRLLRLHRPRRGPDRRRRRRRDRQGRPGGAGHGPDPLDPARRGAAARRARPGPRPGERAAGARDAGADVRHLPVRRPRARDRPLRVRERGPQPALRAHRRTASSSCGRPGLPARPDARDRLRGDRGLRRPGRRDAPVLRRHGRAARPRPRDVRLPAPARGDGDATTPAAQLLDRLLDELHAFTGPGFEQEDDITLVTLRRAAGRGRPRLERVDRAEVELTRDVRRRGDRRRRRAAGRVHDRGRHRQRAGRDAAGGRGRWRRWASSPRASSASRPRSPRP